MIMCIMLFLTEQTGSISLKSLKIKLVIITYLLTDYSFKCKFTKYLFYRNPYFFF